MSANPPDRRNNKLKVLWLCYFTNEEVQKLLKPYRRVGEIAPWISSMIQLFEQDEEIELHVFSQHEWIPGIKSFKRNGVFYYFINKGIPLIGRHWPGIFRFDILTDLLFTKKYVKSVVKKIRPDIIHLHGTENVFCTLIRQFYGKYPVFITIQGLIHKFFPSGKVQEKRIRNEYEILKKFNHFGYRTETMGRDVMTINPNAILHFHSYPKKRIYPIDVNKKYDLVFFARVCKEKGIEDLLQAVSIIKKEKPHISLCVIGGGKLDTFRKLASQLEIKENVFWAGFLPTQDDVHRIASQAKISVLPTYHDVISGTILESMFLKIPVVAYDVGSIHEVNKKEEIISLIGKKNIDELAHKINYLLDNPDIAEKRAEKGYERAHEMFYHSNDEIKNSLLNAYTEVITDFYKDNKN